MVDEDRTSSFFHRLEARQEASSSLLCVGLDPDPDLMQLVSPFSFFSFCRDLVDQTAPFVSAFKIQFACFAAYGLENELVSLICYIHDTYPDIPVILDAKRGDVPVSARHYARECFDRYGADATTVHSYLGVDAVEPFLSYNGGRHGVFVLCRTSNSGGFDLQDCLLHDGSEVFLRVASWVRDRCSDHKNCGLVMGATSVDAIARVRTLCPDLWLLVPGVGVQGGSVEPVIQATQGHRVVITVSRSVCYSAFLSGTTPAAAASHLCALIRQRLVHVNC